MLTQNDKQQFVNAEAEAGNLDANFDKDSESVSSYAYADYSLLMVPCDASCAGNSVSSQESIPYNIRTQVLPIKLAAILNEPRFQQIICWMPHGRAWKVLNPTEFVNCLAPHYFQYPNYNSFIRLVNAWGFRRIKTGVDANAYYHEVS